MERTYVCIDLKSFYASVECVDRGLDPLTANLVVADPDRTEKTICLAITPSMKGARPVQPLPRVRDPRERGTTSWRSRACSATWRRRPTSTPSTCATCRPRNIHPFSIDECFIDATPYLSLYRTSAREFAVMLMVAVLARRALRAHGRGRAEPVLGRKWRSTSPAKHARDCIGFLDQAEFERTIQTHRPITDIWNIGPGIREAPGEVRGVRPARRMRDERGHACTASSA